MTPEQIDAIVGPIVADHRREKAEYKKLVRLAGPNPMEHLRPTIKDAVDEATFFLNLICPTRHKVKAGDYLVMARMARLRGNRREAARKLAMAGDFRRGAHKLLNNDKRMKEAA